MLNKTLKLNENIFRKSVERKSQREAFGEKILELAKKNTKIVALTANLKSSVKLSAFEKEFSERFIEVGIAEQNMAGIAAGLALSDKIPFMVSHAIFSPSRNWDQIRVSIALSNANVKIVGTHAGFSNGPDGSVAEPFEDIALTRVLPNMKVIHPIDSIQTEKAVEALSKDIGPAYLRISKAKTPVITSSQTPFKIGEAQVLMEGADLTIIAAGPIAYEALIAARNLNATQKIKVEVIACPTIKPLDEKTILKSVKKTGRVVTVEEHQIIGGLGGAVAELLSEKLPTKLLRIGLEDCYGESGTYEQLLNKYDLNAQGITERIIKFYGDKQWIY